MKTDAAIDNLSSTELEEMLKKQVDKFEECTSKLNEEIDDKNRRINDLSQESFNLSKGMCLLWKRCNQPF